jgi:CRISPR type I-E-associated protein CasA/Cse1
VKFNVLTDPWVPLEGSAKLASFADVVTGRADAPGLSHPREDFCMFARMLLSALGQALFPARTKDELLARLRAPLPEAQVAVVVARARDGFELVAPSGPTFMQRAAQAFDKNNTGALLLDVSETYCPWLVRHERPYSALCGPCAILALYGFQSHAPAGGRGLSPGVRGAPPLTTLVWRPTVRETLWANTLVEPGADERGVVAPWAGAVKEKGGDDIEPVEGLFWQPRQVRYVVAEAGVCPTCGANGPRLAATGFEAGSKRSGGYFKHPLTPYFEEGIEAQPQRLKVDRPAWTALADMLDLTSRSAVVRKKSDRAYFAAPVVQQWIGALEHRTVSLEVFAFRLKNAKLLARFSERYMVSMQVRDRELIRDLRGAVELAEGALDVLLRRLRLAWSARRKSKQSYWPHEARANFWQRTEAPFWDFKRAQEEGGDAADAFGRALKSTAWRLYEQFTATAAIDERRQAAVATQRKKLGDDLRKLLGPSAEGDKQ